MAHVDNEGDGFDSEEDPPDDEHEHVDVPRVSEPNGRKPSTAEDWSAWRWAEAFFFKANCTKAKSSFCAMQTEDFWQKSSSAGAPLPSVAFEGPADLPKSEAVAILPLKKKRPSSESTETAKSKADFLEQHRPSFEKEVASTLARTQAASPLNQGTLKFYPQPSDDRSSRSVDVIEHGYEVLIVRREPSPTPKCPSDMLQSPGSEHSGELLIPVGASPVASPAEAKEVSPSLSDASI
ncbi:unnamed protein product [Durusdinium trenchii]|uniref:Uncharacterized protein n=1 Tax=Durusdinium trenchii TaxID=1381693 RepID=A0ABP0P796_9DINO